MITSTRGCSTAPSPSTTGGSGPWPPSRGWTRMWSSTSSGIPPPLIQTRTETFPSEASEARGRKSDPSLPWLLVPADPVVVAGCPTDPPSSPRTTSHSATTPSLFLRCSSMISQTAAILRILIPSDPGHQLRTVRDSAPALLLEVNRRTMMLLHLKCF